MLPFKLLDVEKPELAIVFCATKMGARKLAERLKRLYINAREIHGDLHQSRREKIMGPLPYRKGAPADRHRRRQPRHRRQ